MISKRLRYEVLRRDAHTCRYCGAQAPDVKLTVDHVVPVALGGADDPANLVTACQDCNAGKSSSNPDQPLIDGVSADALRWAAGMRRAAEIQASDRERRGAYAEQFSAAWLNWGWDGCEVPRPENWATTLGHWHDLGVEIDLLVELVNDVMPRKNVATNNMWRYFCGAVWNVVRERQEIASSIVAHEDEQWPG